MSNILVKESIPGSGAANSIMSKLSSLGIHDVKLFYDDAILPNGMWAVVQVQGQTRSLIMPESYTQDLQPYILWWCKDKDARFRIPNDEDLMNIVTVVKRAPSIWNKRERRADEFDEKDRKKDEKHQEKFKEKIHQVAPAMKKAIRKELL